MAALRRRRLFAIFLQLIWVYSSLDAAANSCRDKSEAGFGTGVLKVHMNALHADLCVGVAQSQQAMSE